MGNGPAALLATIAAAASTVLKLHFLLRLRASVKEGDQAPARHGFLLPWIVVSAAAFLVPWVLFPPATGIPLSGAFSLDALWMAIWPILLGVAAVAALRWRGRPLPAVPEGDVIVLAERAGPRLDRLVEATLRAEETLRRWPVATGFLLFSSWRSQRLSSLEGRHGSRAERVAEDCWARHHPAHAPARDR